MQKLSLKVLLRFLSSYTHWNLVRRAHGYQLYFVTNNSVGLTQFPSSRLRQKERKSRRRSSKIGRDTNLDIIPAVKKSRALTQHVAPTTPTTNTKDVFVFSPIFENPEHAVSVGLGNIEKSLDEKSKRSSFTSLVWDDECDFTTPYKEEEEEEEGNFSSSSSYTTIESISDDSRDVTPHGSPGAGDMDHKFYETSMRRQGDRLLRDMLELRRDIERDLKRGDESRKRRDHKVDDVVEEETEENSKETPCPHVLPVEESTPGLQVGKAEENMLRERLELMTLQIKKEMDEELQKEKARRQQVEEDVCDREVSEEPTDNYDNIGDGDNENHNVNNSDEVCSEDIVSSMDTLAINTGHLEDSEVITEETAVEENITEKEIEVLPEVTNTERAKLNEDSDNTADIEEKESLDKPVEKTPDKEQITISNSDDMEKTVSEDTLEDKRLAEELMDSFEVKENVEIGKESLDESTKFGDLENMGVFREKGTSRSRTPSVKADRLRKRKKLKKSVEKQSVEIPFCSHNQHRTGLDQGAFSMSLDRKKTKKPSSHTALSPADRIGAEHILHELIEIRDGKQKKEKDPVLDTMISIIQLSSTNLNLAEPASGVPSVGGVQFKELFDFEVNFSESREAFAKLTAEDGTHTVQELFPWTTSNNDKNSNVDNVFSKVRGSLV